MIAHSDRMIHIRRIALVLMGLAAGICAYAILEYLPDLILDARLLLLVSSFGLIAFSAALAMTGPLPPARAALGAVLLGSVVSCLLVWASLRFDAVGEFLETGHPIVAAAAITIVFLPFWIAALRDDARWKDYEVLFDEGWRIVVRTLIALLFTGAVWAVVFLSDSLLGVVGIEVIGDLLEVGVVPFAVTGMAFGLGLAVVHEFADRVTPYLALRLLRLVLPVVVLVTAVFLAVLPFRGLSDLFGNLSAAGILMSVAFTGIALVAIAVDRRGEFAVRPGLLRLSARVMTLFLAILGGLAVWAIALRVAQYGWSPDRVAAMTGAVICLAYGTAYAGVMLSGAGWMRRLRAANIGLALALAGIGILWLTPVIDPQRMSAASQVSRFERGKVSVEALDLWSMHDDWGRAGQAALKRLAAFNTPDAARISERIAALDASSDRRSFEGQLPPAALEALADDVAADLLVRPEGAELPADLLRGVPAIQLRRWREACDRRTDAGTTGCVAVVADFLPDEAGAEVLILTLSGPGYIQISALVPSRSARSGDEVPMQSAAVVEGDLGALSRAETLDRVAARAFDLGPLSIHALELDGERLFILP